ncbi:UDP-N-acetylglucosamine 2-epimerase (hydrolyzing) [Gelidibacter salicanalis]|uniref:UDP-N-acetylglucosamine 2-epimerase (Hydrolyzing) n=1 Tax=Gelidibacter salicanalis TaxID=291193 RepID=A0A5C7AB77_9FLAO|nr:UDP-N-acetylglucosamine 2-epimerase [Gelidibacter salicanalis]TXE05846.1 UDP-N-acetylglucosamine 2-epimerase (hydrolyzing) [Gelidibacter salicanalis]
MESIRNICVVITARPSYSRVKTVLTAINEHPNLQLQLVVAGSALLDRYGNAADYIERDGFKIDERVFMVLEGENKTAMAKTTGLGVMELANVFYNLKPDAVITIADRFETIATSIAAAYQNIPLVHLQGGEVTGNIDEKVRHANTKLADIHFVASEDAKARVIKLGEDADFVFNTGCPSIDIAQGLTDQTELDFNPIEKYGGVGGLTEMPENYLVVLQHPVTNEYHKAKSDITTTLHVINELEIPTFWFWPNVDAGSDGTSNGIRAFREKHNPKHIRFFKNMDAIDFLKLLHHSQCLIGNSSVGIRECSFLGIPVVNIGTRQNRRQRGQNTVDVTYDGSAIKNAILEQLKTSKREASTIYGNGNSGKKIADILATVELRFHKTIMY